MKVNLEERKRIGIEISGKVQGVGFRPTVFRYAKEFGLSGYVCNTSEGLYIEVEGEYEKIKNFIEKIKNSPPYLAELREIKTFSLQVKNENVFSIVESKKTEKIRVEISPDVATCKDCIEEMLDPSNRRYLFPFINCINCGPRFTIIKNIPYDRKNTTMEKFIMCQDCKREYENPEDRRFHTQPNCCFKCGPEVVFLDKNLETIGRNVEAIRKCVEELKNGKIVAIKGIGGFHLACDAKNENSVKLLKRRLISPSML